MKLTAGSIRRADRPTLERFAVYNCLPTAECREDFRTMSLTELRKEIRMDVDFHPWPEQIGWLV